MAKYYEYDKHEFSFRKYDSIDSSEGSSYESDEELKHTTIPKEWNVKFGDVIAMKDYRDTGTIFVGVNHQVVHNPDYSDSGYLSIPLDITKWLFDAYWYYKKIFLDKNQPRVSIDLKPDDQWIISKFGKALPESWKIRLWYSWGEFEDISIKFNDNVEQSFGWNVTYNQLIECSNKANEPRSSFNVWYNIFGEDNIEKFEVYENKTKKLLPSTWVCEDNCSGYGHDHKDKSYTYYGPKSDAIKAYQAVKKYYNNFKGKIDVQFTEPMDGIRCISGSKKDKNGGSQPIFSTYIKQWSPWE